MTDTELIDKYRRKYTVEELTAYWARFFVPSKDYDPNAECRFTERRVKILVERAETALDDER